MLDFCSGRAVADLPGARGGADAHRDRREAARAAQAGGQLDWIAGSGCGGAGCRSSAGGEPRPDPADRLRQAPGAADGRAEASQRGVRDRVG